MPTIATSCKPPPNAADWKAAKGTALLFQTPAFERDCFVREGVPADYIDGLADRLGESSSKLYTLLHIPFARATRRKPENARLSVESSDRVVGFAKLIGQIETIMQESGNPERFNAAHWLRDWISRPSAALGNHRPEELLYTSDGREMISEILARGQTGAYS